MDVLTAESFNIHDGTISNLTPLQGQQQTEAGSKEYKGLEPGTKEDKKLEAGSSQRIKKELSHNPGGKWVH